MAQLSDSERLALLLRKKRIRRKEIAQALGITETAVKNRLMFPRG